MPGALARALQQTGYLSNVSKVISDIVNEKKRQDFLDTIAELGKQIKQAYEPSVLTTSNTQLQLPEGISTPQKSDVTVPVPQFKVDYAKAVQTSQDILSQALQEALKRNIDDKTAQAAISSLQSTAASLMPRKKEYETAKEGDILFERDPYTGEITNLKAFPKSPSQTGHLIGAFDPAEFDKARKIGKNFTLPKYAINPTTGEFIKKPDGSKIILGYEKFGEEPIRFISPTELTKEDANDIAEAIVRGDLPPTLRGLYKNAGPVLAALAKKKLPDGSYFNLSLAALDFDATRKFLATKNNDRQMRIRESISTLEHALPLINDLYTELEKELKHTGFKYLDKAQLKIAKNLPGKAGQLAHQLDAEIVDVIEALANIYMGGNSPTDKALDLAKQQLSSDWNPETFKAALKQAMANVSYRKAAMNASVPFASPNNKYYNNKNKNTDINTNVPSSGLDVRTMDKKKNPDINENTVEKKMTREEFIEDYKKNYDGKLPSEKTIEKARKAGIWE
jgi:hypothetical protein